MRVEMPVAKVVRRQPAGFAERAQDARGAVVVQARDQIEMRAHPFRNLLHAGRIRDFHRTLARLGAHRDCFQILRSHHRAQAVPPDGVRTIVHDRGKAHALFARGTDQRGAQRVVAEFRAQRVFGFAGRLAPQVRRVAEFHAAVVNPEVRRFLRAPGNNNAVEAGALEFRAPVSAALRVAKAIRQRRFRAYTVAPLPRHRRAGQRSRRKDQNVSRIERIDAARQFVQQIVCHHPAPTEVRAVERVIVRLDLRFSICQINAQDFAGVAVGHACLPS